MDVSISWRILTEASSGLASGGKSFLPMLRTKSNSHMGISSLIVRGSPVWRATNAASLKMLARRDCRVPRGAGDPL